MQHRHVFGYGSLVNRATHDYAVVEVTRIRGWRRVWRHTATRTTAFLTVTPDTSGEIDGLVTRVPRQAWSALDDRERSYELVTLTPEHLQGTATGAVQLYSARAAASAPPSLRHPILMSYLDMVVEGYLEVFGERGVEAFFSSTDGWDGPVLDDRTAPRYDRHRPVHPEVEALTDAALAGLPAQVQKPE